MIFCWYEQKETPHGRKETGEQHKGKNPENTFI